MARGHRLNTSIVLAAVHGLRSFSGGFRGRAFTLSSPSHSVPVPNKPSRFRGRKATMKKTTKHTESKKKKKREKTTTTDFNRTTHKNALVFCSPIKISCRVNILCCWISLQIFRAIDQLSIANNYLFPETDHRTNPSPPPPPPPPQPVTKRSAMNLRPLHAILTRATRLLLVMQNMPTPRDQNTSACVKWVTKEYGLLHIHLREFNPTHRDKMFCG